MSIDTDAFMVYGYMIDEDTMEKLAEEAGEEIHDGYLDNMNQKLKSIQLDFCGDLQEGFFDYYVQIVLPEGMELSDPFSYDMKKLKKRVEEAKKEAKEHGLPFEKPELLSLLTVC